MGKNKKEELKKRIDFSEEYVIMKTRIYDYAKRML